MPLQAAESAAPHPVGGPSPVAATPAVVPLSKPYPRAPRQAPAPPARRTTVQRRRPEPTPASPPPPQPQPQPQPQPPTPVTRTTTPTDNKPTTRTRPTEPAAHPGPSSPAPEATPADLDDLARRLLAPLSRLLRAELRGDRERIGRLRDHGR
ncbi:hypothetical protein DMA15_28580 [Streptomyces sp. WAC 01529]|nr:hypothetical protein DMA15_28580 [Streptomyces sp. WAC 01529]